MRRRETNRGRRLLATVVTAVALASLGGLGTGPPAAADTPGSCPSPNPPNELILGGGTPQTAQLDTAFDGPLQVSLANSNGCPVTSVVGTPITFSAPSSGASGHFATSGSNVVTVGADVSGGASAPAFTANGTAGSYTVTATSGYGSVLFSLTNSAAGIPAAIRPLSPGTESAPTNSGYPHPLSVVVLDAGGNPVSGAAVTFTLGGTAVGGGAAGTPSAAANFVPGGSAQATAITGSDGVATSPPFAANGAIGRFSAIVTVANGQATASFALVNLPGKSARLTRIGSAERAATVGQRYDRRLRILVRDAGGRPEIGASVTFTLGSGGGGATGAGAGAGATFAGGSSTATAITGISGIATSPAFTAGSAAGTFSATATTAATASVARFTLDDRAGRPATITAGIAATEATRVGTRFVIALAVTVTDSHGNKVPGAPVTFTAPASGASGSFAGSTSSRSVTVRTDSHGIAVAPPFVANRQPGGYIVLATVGHGARTAFALVNEGP